MTLEKYTGSSNIFEVGTPVKVIKRKTTGVYAGRKGTIVSRMNERFPKALLYKVALKSGETLTFWGIELEEIDDGDNP